MIKFVANTEDHDGPLLGLGISEANVQMLRQGKPILINAEDLAELTGWKGSIALFYGKTEEDIEKSLVPLIGPGTKLKL